MALKTAEASVGVGLGTAALTYAIYNISLPPLTDVRAVESENQDIQSSERAATWVSAAFVTGVALVTKDATVFVIGGIAVVMMAWLYRHADQVSPATGKANVVKLSVPGMTQMDEPQEQVTYVDEVV